MESAKWNVGKAARNGALLGAPLLAFRSIVFGEALPHDAAELAGYILGGTIGGSLLFAGAVTVANIFIR